MRRALQRLSQEIMWFVKSLTVYDGWMLGFLVGASAVGMTIPLFASIFFGFLLLWPIARWFLFKRPEAVAFQKKVDVLQNADSTLEDVEDVMKDLRQNAPKTLANIGLYNELKKRRNKLTPIGFARR